jgi:transmembrane sensor
MSGNVPENNTSANAHVEECAASWIGRQQFETWNGSEQEKLDLWLAQSDNHKAAYWRLKAGWNRTDRLAALRSSGDAPVATTRSWMRRGFAFGLVLIASMAGAFFYFNQPHRDTYSTSIGGHTTIALADGSAIDLNTDTAVDTEISAQRRIVYLRKGEAFFRIRHNTRRPFIVMTQNHRIVDLGTQFLVRTASRKFEVDLIEGRARVESADEAAQHGSALLAPGDTAIVTTDGMKVSRKSAGELANELGWRQGVLIFHNTSLADAAEQFDRYGDAKLVIADADTARLTINGTFRTTGIDNFAGVTREIFGLRVQKRGNNIILSR